MMMMTMMMMRRMKRKKKRKKKKVGNPKKNMMVLSVLIFHLVMILTVLFHADGQTIVSHRTQNPTRAKAGESPVESQENIEFLNCDNPIFYAVTKMIHHHLNLCLETVTKCA